MIYLILSILLLTSAVLATASASRNGNTVLVALVINMATILAPLLVVAPKLFKKTAEVSAHGFKMAVLSGLLIGIYAITLNKAFTQNKVGIIAPVLYGGTIVLSTVLAYFIYKERITSIELVGFCIILVGLGVILYARATAT